MKNEYEIRGEVTAIFLKSPKYGDMEALVSTSKLEILKNFTTTWFPKLLNKKKFYVWGNMTLENGDRTMIQLHRLITNAPDEMVVDHINHNTLDNTDKNLRVVTKSGNGQNRQGAQRNSKSGVRGVYWDSRGKRWVAQIRLNNKAIHIGGYKTIEEAEFSARKARIEQMTYSKEAIT